MPYEQLLTERQKATWFIDGSSKMNGQHFIWKAATSRLADGKTEEGKINGLARLNCVLFS